MARFAPTIPITSISSRDPELSISKNDWRRIELAYGHAVAPTARKQIREATLTFLLLAGGEQVARPISEARDRIVKIKAAAMAVHKAIFDNPQDNRRDSK